MKKIAIFLVLFPTLLLTAAETRPAGGWQETGELAYSYAYARSVLGHRMRRDGWVCTFGFTAGKCREQEHSVWQKGRRRSIRPIGMGSGMPQKLPVCVPFYLKKNSISGAPTSFYHVDASLLPDHVRAKDLFAVRIGAFNGLPADSDVEPGDILIVWTRPEHLHPGMIVLERTGSASSCRQVKMESEPGPGTLGQVIALLRPLN